MAKITLKNTQTIEDAFEDFIFYKNTQGVTEKTIIYYRTTFQSISKHLDTTINISDLMTGAKPKKLPRQANYIPYYIKTSAAAEITLCQLHLYGTKKPPVHITRRHP